MMLEEHEKEQSTGLDQTALGAITTGFQAEDMNINDQDTAILRRLAERVAKIAASSEMSEKRQRWQNLNDLRPERPVILCDPENGWNEIITDRQMLCQGKLARRWEMNLRKDIFWGEVMGDDKPVEPYFVVPYTVKPENWGVETVFHHSDSADGSMSWDAPIKNYDEDLPKLKIPEIEIDRDVSGASFQIAKDVFEPILKVRQRGTWWWSLGITLPAVMLRGLTNLFMDMIDKPDELKELFSLISRAHMHKLDFLEAGGLLTQNNDGTYVGSGGYGFTTDISTLASIENVRCSNMWGFAESQETVSVSPEMYAEFVFPYEKPVLDRFALNCYGCCEPVDPRWQTVKQHHNLRRVSCSPWSNYEKMVNLLGKDYIFSMKANPAQICTPNVDFDSVRQQLREDLATTKGCVVEIIMKDNHTLGGCPKNAVNWCKIANEEIARIYK